MNVMIDGKGLGGLRLALERDGDKVVPLGEVADLVLTTDEQVHAPNVVNFGGELGRSSLRALGLCVQEEEEDEPAPLFYSRWWDENGWMDQVVLGVPLRGMMNDDLGEPVVGGLAMRFAQQTPGVLECEKLEETLREMKHRGWVSWEVGWMGLGRVILGLPEHAIYPLMECVRGSIARWFLEPSKLMEKWICGLVVSRAPWPWKERDERIEIDVPDDILRHLWLHDVRASRLGVYMTDSTLLGVITGWDLGLSDASWRVLRSARNLVVPKKQFRTDLGFRVKEILGRLAVEGMI